MILNQEQLPDKLHDMIKAGLLQENSENDKLRALRRMISISDEKNIVRKIFLN